MIVKKRWLALLLALCVTASLSACGGGASQTGGGTADADGAEDAALEDAAEDAVEGGAETASDLAYVVDKGTLVIGITEFEPMDYQDADGEWIGFDADLARAFAGSLGVEPVFQIVDWDNKVFELEGHTIDVVWNGMTLTDEVLGSMECSAPYFNNAQVVVVPVELASTVRTAEDVAGLTFAVESGSAGKEQAEDYGFTYTEVSDQANALLEVSSGTADAAIVDILMAMAMTGEGTSYEGLTYTVRLNSEEYGVGFRQGSDLAPELDRFFVASYEDGTMRQIAETYGIADALIEQ